MTVSLSVSPGNLHCRTFNVHSYGQWHILLADGTQQGTQMYQPVNSVCHHNLLQSLEVQYVSENVRTCNV